MACQTSDPAYLASRGGRCSISKRRGAVLILVLIVFSGLSLLAFGLCHRVRLELRMSQMRGDQMRAFYLALGGVNRSVQALRQDLAERQQDIVHFGQKWHLNTTAAAEGFFTDMDDAWHSACALSYATSDEEGRLSISKSWTDGWQKLPGMTEPIRQAILDWEDTDDSPNPQGAESADYMRQAFPYRAKNADMASVWELARVMGVDQQRFLGEDANGNSLLDPNEDDGAAAWPPDNADGRLDHGLIDYFTVYGDEKVNLNTASPEVLAALQGIETGDVQEIMDYRLGNDRQPFTADDGYFSSADDLNKPPNLRALARDRLEEDGQFTSQHFRVISHASVRKDAPGVRLWATIRRTGQDVQLIFLTRF